VSDARKPVVARAVLRIQDGGASPRDASALDEVAVEEPLEIRVAGETLAVTMRTPGEDRQLALGFLLAEGIIASVADVGSAVHCGRSSDQGYGNTIEVAPGPGVALDPRVELVRRGTLISASCGVCGRRSIDDLLERCEPLPAGPSLPLALLVGSTSALHRNQPHFARTGGLHAAAVLDAEGRVLAVSEDVGRHNAVDKVVGALLLSGVLPLRARDPIGSQPCLLVVSGRVSFEIVQKAVMAGIATVCGVSAPTSLAIDLAVRTNVTLAAFVRDGALNLYSHAERIAGVPHGR
jgi:FdhD protein